MPLKTDSVDTQDEAEAEVETILDLQNGVWEVVVVAGLPEFIFRQSEMKKLFDLRCLTTCKNLHVNLNCNFQRSDDCFSIEEEKFECDVHLYLHESEFETLLRD